MSNGEVSRAQHLVLELLRLVKHNLMDGERIATDLLEHRHLWLAIMSDAMSRRYDWSNARIVEPDLVKLAGLELGMWAVDSLFVITPRGEEERKQMEALARTWSPDDVHWYDEGEVEDMIGSFSSSWEDCAVLFLWWD